MDPRVERSIRWKPVAADKHRPFPPEQNHLAQISCSKDYQQQNLQLYIYHLQKELLMSNSTSSTKTKTLSNRAQETSRTTVMICTFILKYKLYKHELQAEKQKYSSALVLMNYSVLKNYEDYDSDYWLNSMET